MPQGLQGAALSDAHPIERVAVAILTWNGLADTLACLASLTRTGVSARQIVIADNGSTDRTLEVVRDRYPDILAIENGANLGFAQGNNTAISAALDRAADAVLILNNDTVVCPHALEQLVAAMDADPRVGACSPVVAFASTPDKFWFAGASFDPRRARAGRASRYEEGAPLPARSTQIDRAVGAAMLVRSQTINEVGGMADELFFLYEDVDWSLRMRQAGWQIVLVPQARVLHRVSASQGGERYSPTIAYYGTRNDLEIGRRHGGLRGWRAVWREFGCVFVHLAGARRAARSQRGAYAAAALAGWRDYRARRFGPRKR